MEKYGEAHQVFEVCSEKATEKSHSFICKVVMTFADCKVFDGSPKKHLASQKVYVEASTSKNLSADLKEQVFQTKEFDVDSSITEGKFTRVTEGPLGKPRPLEVMEYGAFVLYSNMCIANGSELLGVVVLAADKTKQYVAKQRNGIAAKEFMSLVLDTKDRVDDFCSRNRIILANEKSGDNNNDFGYLQDKPGRIITGLGEDFQTGKEVYFELLDQMIIQLHVADMDLNRKVARWALNVTNEEWCTACAHIGLENDLVNGAVMVSIVRVLGFRKMTEHSWLQLMSRKLFICKFLECDDIGERGIGLLSSKSMKRKREPLSELCGLLHNDWNLEKHILWVLVKGYRCTR